MESDHPVLDRLVAQALPAHSAERAGPGLATRVVGNAGAARSRPFMSPFHPALAAAAALATYMGLAGALAPSPVGEPSAAVVELDSRTGGWATRGLTLPDTVFLMDRPELLLADAGGAR